MRAISLFSGIGGFDLAGRRLGIKTVAACENDRFAAGVFSNKFWDCEIFCDIRNLLPQDMPDAEIITMGFPCEDISQAGKRRGFLGEKSGLFYEGIRIVAEQAKRKNLRFFVAENVPLWQQDGLAEAVQALMQCGADEAGWRVLDSRSFGVPQRRRRMFLVGVFGGESASKVLGFQNGRSRDVEAGRTAQNQNAVAIENRPQKASLAVYSKGDAKGGMKSGLGTLTTKSGDPDRFCVLEGDDKLRRLMPKECERFQGFPEGWTEFYDQLEQSGNRWLKLGKMGLTSDTQRYAQLGRAVTVPVAKWLLGNI